MSDDFTGADFTAAGGDTSTASAPEPSVATVDTTAQTGTATTEPAAAATASISTDPAKQPGPIPFDSHKTALENARTKAVEEWKQRYGWAEQVDRTQVEQAVRLSALFNSDRAAFVRELIGENPPAELISEFARQLSGRRGAAAQEQEPQPDFSIQSEDGRVVPMYSAEQQAKREAWLQQRWSAALEQKFAPAMQTAEQFRAATERYELAQQAGHFASTFGADLQKLPHFDEVKGELRTRLAQIELPKDAPPAAVEAVTFRLYTQLLSEQVLPKLQTEASRKVLHDINQKAAVTGVAPNAPSASAPKELKDMSWTDALKTAFTAAKV